MQRKRAIVAAATVAGTLLAASTAYAFTSGVVDTPNDDGAGELTPVVDTPTTAPQAQPPASSRVDVSDGYEDDDRYDDDYNDDHDDGHDDDHDDGLVEYEGGEDDD